MRNTSLLIKQLLGMVVLMITHTLLFSQIVGNSVSILGVDGKKYTGVIKNITNEWYQIKYDNYDALRWFTANQFTLINTRNEQVNLVGKGVNFTGTDGKTYTGIVQEVQGNKYLIKYDGYDFESWLDRDQFSINTVRNIATNTNVKTNVKQPETFNTNINAAAALKNIYNFGNGKGWSSPLYESKYNSFTQNLSAEQIQSLILLLQKANTLSAQFFALKSLLTGDSYETVTNFITQLNEHDETYQQENCIVTNMRSIIQQWQFSCSVTVLQTYLADLCPRYAWEVKQIANYDKVAADPTYPMAVQQKELLEKYGGVATTRGDVSGTPIGIISGLNELVGAIVGVNFYAQETTAEPLSDVFSKMRNQLDRGINMPLLIGFTGSTNRHFILALRYRKTNSGHQYLIYDPWEGKCDYVSETAIMQGSIDPLMSGTKITLDYYYPVN